LARTDTFMPMKPATPDSTAPSRKPIATVMPSRQATQHEQHDADDGDGGVLPLQIGGRALLDRLRDLLHALIARVAGQDILRGDDAIGDGQRPKRDHEDQPNGQQVMDSPWS
jgi:hypothetical protein